MTEGPVIFDQEITNIGNGYSTNTGMFSVPANGLYAFSWTAETHGELTETSLVANGVSRGSAIAHEIGSHYDTTTSFAILELQANDIVYVNVTQGRAQGERTMFSGWKINDKGKLKLSRAKTYKNHKATPSIPKLFSELVYLFYAPLEKGGILFCNCRSVCRSVGRSVDQVLSGQYLLTSSLDQYQTWCRGCPQ